MILKKVFFVKNYEFKSASNLTLNSALKSILHAQIATYKSFISTIKEIICFTPPLIVIANP